ncbi:hypothetical protein OIU85_001504 [Salix viminalis]|uniref:Uncharacterized protein n=1 Tax=Salix viminalis TaxID=40686 RepID=A0A9Q0VLW4_SALVM|nr:hypothetical protein OIU85_001504 [Salix viminalis]
MAYIHEIRCMLSSTILGLDFKTIKGLLNIFHRNLDVCAKTAAFYLSCLLCPPILLKLHAAHSLCVAKFTLVKLGFIIDHDQSISFRCSSSKHGAFNIHCD